MVNLSPNTLVVDSDSLVERRPISPTEGFKLSNELRYRPQDSITMNHADLLYDSLVSENNNSSRYNTSLMSCQSEKRDIHRADALVYRDTQLVQKENDNNNASPDGGNHEQTQSIYNHHRKETPGLPKRSMVKVSFRNDRRGSFVQKPSDQGQGMMPNEEQGVSSHLQLPQPLCSYNFNNLSGSREGNPLSNEIRFTPYHTDAGMPLPLKSTSNISQGSLFHWEIPHCEVERLSAIHDPRSAVNNKKYSTQANILMSPVSKKQQHDQNVVTQPQNWIQNPILFYLSENLIKLHELRSKIRHTEIGNEVSTGLEVGGNSFTTPDSSFSYEYKAQIETLKRYVTYSVSEIDAILLNPLFTRWSEQHLFNLVKRVTTSWKFSGPDSKEFEEASFLLLQAISEERSGTIRHTLLYWLREYLGSVKHYCTGFYFLSVMSFASLLFTILLAVFGYYYLSLRIVFSVLLSITILSMHCFSSLILNHNASADATAAFFKMEILYLSNDDVNIESEDSFFSPRQPGSRSVYPSNGHITLPGTHVTNEGSRTCKDPFCDLNTLEDDETIFISMEKKLPQQAQTEHPEPSEHSKRNGAPSRSHAFEGQRQAENSHHVVRRTSKASTSTNDLLTGKEKTLNTSKGNKDSEAFSLKDTEVSCATINSTFIIDLADNISVTALIYCKDEHALSIIMSSLWEFNFLVLRTDLSQIDNVYQQGSDKFKIIILHAPDLQEGSSEYDTALSWVKGNLPVFFFSLDNCMFPCFVPLSNRLQLPLSEKNITNLLLFGTAKNEGLSSTKTGSLSKPLKVPPYTLGRRLGGGAYGNVFEAEMETLGVMCAVKRIYLRNGSNTDPDDNNISQLRDIAREVEIMSSLTHPNIVKYMFFERDDNCISIFMELCLGGSLSSMISGGELVDPEFIKQVLRDIISAVAYLHKKKVTHRDLKPDNVLFSNGRAKITDFGTAILKRNRDDLSPVTGTFAYMAPEIILCETYGKACDMWSIGCIAAEILKVDLPQRSLGLPGMCEFYRKMDPSSPLSIDCSVLEVSDFLRSCLQRNPSARPTAAELLHHNCLKHNNTAFDKWIKEVISRSCLSYPHTVIAMDVFGSNESVVDLGFEFNGMSLKSLDDVSNV